ncbi:MAG: (d)CMP kinase [Gemmatimonadales bacterium]
MTLDGPAGSGKSTTAREVARRLGFRHLDSGALYRALTFALLDAGVPESEWPTLRAEDLRALDVELRAVGGGFEVSVGGRPVSAELRTRAVTDRVATLARLAAARACLLELQRRAGEEGRLVADGRDMGTVVFPDADVKVYLVADLEERARRRLRELGVPDPTPERVAVEVDAIHARDSKDAGRDLSPLRKAEGSVEIDTTRLTFEEQVARIVELVRQESRHGAPS